MENALPEEEGKQENKNNEETHIKICSGICSKLLFAMAHISLPIINVVEKCENVWHV